MAVIAEYYAARADPGNSLDDRTRADLDLDAVFMAERRGARVSADR